MPLADISAILLLIAKLAEALAPLLRDLGQPGAMAPTSWSAADLPVDVQQELRRLVTSLDTNSSE